MHDRASTDTFGSPRVPAAVLIRDAIHLIFEYLLLSETLYCRRLNHHWRRESDTLPPLCNEQIHMTRKVSKWQRKHLEHVADTVIVQLVKQHVKCLAVSATEEIGEGNHAWAEGVGGCGVQRLCLSGLLPRRFPQSLLMLLNACPALHALQLWYIYPPCIHNHVEFIQALNTWDPAVLEHIHSPEYWVEHNIMLGLALMNHATRIESFSSNMPVPWYVFGPSARLHTLHLTGEGVCPHWFDASMHEYTPFWTEVAQTWSTSTCFPRTLRVLNIAYLQTITAEALTALVGALPCLEELNMVNCRNVGRNFFVGIAAHVPRLQTLHATHPESDEQVSAIARFPLLRSLYLHSSSCVFATWPALLAPCITLRDLYVNQLTASVAEIPPERLGAYHHLKQLRTLHINTDVLIRFDPSFDPANALVGRDIVDLLCALRGLESLHLSIHQGLQVCGEELVCLPQLAPGLRAHWIWL